MGPLVPFYQRVPTLCSVSLFPCRYIAIAIIPPFDLKMTSQWASREYSGMIEQAAIPWRRAAGTVKSKIFSDLLDAVKAKAIELGQDPDDVTKVCCVFIAPHRKQRDIILISNKQERLKTKLYKVVIPVPAPATAVTANSHPVPPVLVTESSSGPAIEGIPAPAPAAIVMEASSGPSSNTFPVIHHDAARLAADKPSQPQTESIEISDDDDRYDLTDKDGAISARKVCAIFYEGRIREEIQNLCPSDDHKARLKEYQPALNTVMSNLTPEELHKCKKIASKMSGARAKQNKAYGFRIWYWV